jgi:hypothetical protein
MACIDDDWENFLTQGTIILSNEKQTAKKDINKVYSENDKISQSMNSINKKLTSLTPSLIAATATATATAPAPAMVHKSQRKKGSVRNANIRDIVDDGGDDSGDDIDDDIDPATIFDTENENILDSVGLNHDGEVEVQCEGGEGGECDENVDNIKPICSNIYISTKTKISYLNMPIDIKRVFWNIPISPYSTPSECIIKKQIKVSTTDPAELKEIKELLTKEKYYQEQEIEHIDNPEGRIKFKVQLKINIGLCKKDILNYRCKLKRAFFNCFVLIMRIKDRATDSFKEMHLKVFNTGKLEIPGIQTDESLTQVLDLLISILKPIVGESVGYIPNKCETVLINSNFNCGYFIEI